MTAGEIFYRIWARRLLLVKRLPFAVIGVVIIISTHLKSGDFAQDVVTAIVGLVFLGFAATSLAVDWQTNFIPRFVWRNDGKGKITANTVIAFCERKRIACHIDEDYGRGTGMGFAAGFITEDDLVMAKMSL